MESENNGTDNTRTILSVLSRKKNTAKKAAVEKKNKDEEATAKVQELLRNTSVASLVGASQEIEKEENQFNVDEHQEERTKNWLENQVNELNRQVEEYENELVFYREELKKLQEIMDMGGGQFIQPNSNPNQPHNIVHNTKNPLESSMNHTLIELYKHFENLHFRYNQNGDFSIKLSYPSTGNGILEKFIEYFPQLDAVRRYGNRGF